MGSITPTALAKSIILATELISKIETAAPSEVREILNGLSNRQLITVINEIRNAELAKLSKETPQPWDDKSPMPPLTPGMRLSENARDDIRLARATITQTQTQYKNNTDKVMTEDAAKLRKADFKKWAIINLEQYFKEKRMTATGNAGKLYKSKKNKKNKSKRRHKKNIRKTRRRM